jgi:hypothetical protein
LREAPSDFPLERRKRPPLGVRAGGTSLQFDAGRRRRRFETGLKPGPCVVPSASSGRTVCSANRARANPPWRRFCPHVISAPLVVGRAGVECSATQSQPDAGLLFLAPRSRRATRSGEPFVSKRSRSVATFRQPMSCSSDPPTRTSASSGNLCGCATFMANRQELTAWIKRARAEMCRMTSVATRGPPRCQNRNPASHLL